MDDTDKLVDKAIEQSKKQRQILTHLDKLEEPYRLILEEIYINNRTLVEVASELGYSYRNITRKLNIALRKFENI